jgi:hypothetical protein
MNQPSIAQLVDDFVARVVALVSAEAQSQARAAVLAALGSGGTASSKAAATPTASSRRKPRLTPATLELRKLQGRYMGLLRGLKGAKRAQVKKMAKEKGVAEAVKLAQKLAA